MKGDFTRLTHDPAKHYSKTRRQQGRADVDADFNEQVDIQEYLDATTRVDVIGRTGFPKGDSFELSVLADGTVQIHPGRAYVDGILHELFGNAPVDYLDQIPEPPPVNPAAGRRDLVYLDVWERHITALQDPAIKEVALGGADTATRVQIVGQIRIRQNIGAGIECDNVPNWPPAPSGALMTTSLDVPAIPPDPCSPVPGSAFRGLENRLYRVEIHQAGNLGAARFKWSRDNGAVTFGIRQFRPNEAKRVELARLGRDQILTLKNGTWAEILGDETELAEAAGTMTRVNVVDNASRIVTFDDDVDSHSGEAHPIVRRWEGAPELATPIDFELEDGIRVRFGGANFKVGDYWIFTTRTAEQGGLEILNDAAPRGITHHYAKLGIIEWVLNNNAWVPVISDCRPQFPPLTDIHADDVKFESQCFGPDVETVEDALEQLCAAEHDCCTLVAEPGPGWEAVFAQIPPQGSASICFRVGDYPISTPDPFVVANLGHLKLTGAGRGTRIRALNSECAVRFTNCASVTMRDLHAESSVSGFGEHMHDLNGPLTFVNCDHVSLSSLDVSCPNAPNRRSTCLTIRNAFPPPANLGLVEVEDCDFLVGDQQVGLLVVNARRAMIRNNRVRSRSVPVTFFDAKLQNKHARSAMVSALASHISFADANEDSEDGANFVRKIGDQELRFTTDKKLVKPWGIFLDENPPEELNAPAVAEHVARLARGALLGNVDDVPLPFLAFVGQLRNEETAAASQGITVAGRIAEELTIADNSIEGAAQGIHVGLSHADPARTNPDHGGRVAVTRNRIHVRAIVGATRSRHAIFVGNADSIIIRENYANLTRFTGMQEGRIDAIRVFGYFGRYVNVRENHVSDFSIGIQVQVRGTPANAPMWQVYDNLTSHAQTSVLKNTNLVNVQGNVS